MQLKVPTRTTGEDIFALLVVLVGLKVSTSSSAAKMPTITTSGWHINKEGRKIQKP